MHHNLCNRKRLEPGLCGIAENGKYVFNAAHCLPKLRTCVAASEIHIGVVARPTSDKLHNMAQYTRIPEANILLSAHYTKLFLHVRCTKRIE